MKTFEMNEHIETKSWNNKIIKIITLIISGIIRIIINSWLWNGFLASVFTFVRTNTLTLQYFSNAVYYECWNIKSVRDVSLILHDSDRHSPLKMNRDKCKLSIHMVYKSMYVFVCCVCGWFGGWFI